MAENIKNTVSDHVNKDSANWISQINAGDVTYDIATHHSITFKDGKGDAKGIEWNGLSDLEIIIPNITDIVQTPIEFAGTVAASETITWNDSHKDGPQTGYLVFVTATCTFAGQAVEAGDMAIYDGTNWQIVSGENQVKIVNATDINITDTNRTVVAVGAAKDVLVVEGKALSLTLDYAELDTHIETTGGAPVSVKFGSADGKNPEVKSEHIKLVYTEASDREIATQVSFENATALANGKVNFTEGKDTFVTSVSFGEFSAGSFPTYNSNGVINLDVAPGSLSTITGEDFVTSVSLSAVSVVKANDGDVDNVFTAVTGISAITGKQSFLTDIHLTDKGETANLTIGGYLAPNAGVSAAFVTGLADNKTTVITDITAGEFSIVGSGAGLGDFVTGLEGGATEVVTAVTVSANNNTSVLNEAKVENHVLSFGSTNVTSEVTATPTTAAIKTSGVSYTKTAFTSTSLLSDGFKMTSDVNYTFGSAKETVYDYDTYSWKVVTPELGIEKGKYTIENGGTVTIEADTFLTSVKSEGTLPSLTNTSFYTGKVEGSVATALSTSTVNINALAEGVTSIATPGKYSLTTVAAAEEGVTVTVGKAGVLDNMAATVDLTKYLTDVTIATDAPKAE